MATFSSIILLVPGGLMKRSGSPHSIQRRGASSRHWLDPPTAVRPPKHSGSRTNGNCASLIAISTRLSWPGSLGRRESSAPRAAPCHIRTRRLVQHEVDLVTNRGQLQPVEDCGRRRDWPFPSPAPPSGISCSAGDRRRNAGGRTGGGASTSATPTRWRPTSRDGPTSNVLAATVANLMIGRDFAGMADHMRPALTDACTVSPVNGQWSCASRSGPVTNASTSRVRLGGFSYRGQPVRLIEARN